MSEYDQVSSANTSYNDLDGATPHCYKIVVQKEKKLDRYLENEDVFLKGSYQTVSITPGLLKIAFEILDNCVDEHIRTKGKFANISGEDRPNVHLAMDFLTAVQKRELDEKVDNFIDVKDKKVVVVGGGDTAMDCVRTSVREGATSVKCLYRRDEVNMPGSKKEVVNSKEEGVEFIFNVSPLSIEDNGIILQKTTLSENTFLCSFRTGVT